MKFLFPFAILFVPPVFAQLFVDDAPPGPAPHIYHDGWVDFNKNGSRDIFETPAQKTDARIADLLGQMTINEKTAQLATLYGFGRVLGDELPTPEWEHEIWKDGLGNIDEHLSNTITHPRTDTKYSFPFSLHAEALNTVQRWFVENTRLGIPVDFTNEGIRGLRHMRATCFPSNLAMGCTWNHALFARMGEIIGAEARALGYTNVYAPILDLPRDPRWGRVVETYGEDPYLVAEYGKLITAGIQSHGVVSTLKHFGVYSVPKGGRDGDARTDPHVAPREMLQMYMYPFKQVIQHSNALGVMSSYNDWDGLPVSSSKYFLTDLLRKDFGFQGYVVSDSAAAEFPYEKHHVATDMTDGYRQIAEAGLNIRTNFSMPQDYILPLRELVNSGRLSMATLDGLVADVLRVKFWLGLFDYPYTTDPAAADQIVRSAEHVAIGRQASYEAVVLLKNDNHALPLDADQLERILVTGPNAKAESHSISRYGPSHIDITSVLEGITAVVGDDAEIVFAEGCDFVDRTWPESEIFPVDPDADEQAQLDAAVEAAQTCDVAIVVLGDSEQTVGESTSRTSLDLPGYQTRLVQEIAATGTPVVVVLLTGRPASINWIDRHVPAIVHAGFPGEFGGDAIADVLFGHYNPGGKLTTTWPKTVGQIELNFPYKPASHGGQPSYGANGTGNSRIKGALYDFGFGLSYTTFAYHDLKISPQTQHAAGSIDVSFTLTNTGARAGDEVVQLYINDEVTSVTQYVYQLRGFERVHMEPGESKTIDFTLQPSDLQLLDINMNEVVEPGKFNVKIGRSSTDFALEGSFVID